MDGSWMLAWKDGIGGWEEEEEDDDDGPYTHGRRGRELVSEGLTKRREGSEESADCCFAVACRATSRWGRVFIEGRGRGRSGPASFPPAHSGRV